MRRGDRLRSAFGWITAALLVFAFLAAPARAADERLLLAVVVNGYSTDKIGQFVMRGGALLARPAELRDLGFRVPEGVRETADKLVPLTALPGVSSRLDQHTQTLYVTAAAEHLLPALLSAGEAANSNIPVESGLGATLDYDTVGTLIGNQAIGSGLFDTRAFSPWGVLSSGTLVHVGAASLGSMLSPAVRLDTTWTYSDPQTLRRYRVGDFINGGLGWTRPVRLGGAQLVTDFSMRPDLVTFPLPSIGGTVAVPSTVDVMVNGLRVFSREVAPGPFQIPQLPVVTGAGTVSMTVTDALGRQVATVLPFYASSNLLASGLQTYSVEAGAVRRNWGLVSNDYGSLSGSATYRRGLWSVFTVETHAEAAPGLVMAGAGGVLDFFNLAVLNFAAAGSGNSGRAGTQLSAGMQRLGRVVSFGGSATFADGNFRDLAAVNGDPAPRLSLNANAGLSLSRFGSLGAAYTSIDRLAVAVPSGSLSVPGSTFIPGVSLPTSTLLPAQHTRIASASYSVELFHLSLFATAFHDFAGRDTGALIGLTIPLGPRSSATVSGSSEAGSRSAQVQATQSPVEIGDWGYQVFAQSNAPRHEFGQVQYKSPWALLTAGADRVSGQTTLQTEAQGAVSLIDGSLFPSNTINDSFAVVDTDGVPGVRVRYENREAGVTDAAGKVLVPDLLSFQANQIAIEPTDVAIDRTVPFGTREVRPMDRSGVVVHFPLHRSDGALLKLVDEAGKPEPLGSVATLRATGATAPVGYEGEAYFEGLQPHDEVRVERPNGERCSVAFDYRPTPGRIPKIGPLTCRRTAR
ncbi:MAG TPA: fimbria/pilus outer membrane usher protein [Stellaceae bacterium]|nr:fimbria/pilus outer membrane usher protein [Stellaceae bacterium]